MKHLIIPELGGSSYEVGTSHSPSAKYSENDDYFTKSGTKIRHQGPDWNWSFVDGGHNSSGSDPTQAQFESGTILLGYIFIMLDFVTWCLLIETNASSNLERCVNHHKPHSRGSDQPFYSMGSKYWMV